MSLNGLAHTPSWAGSQPLVGKLPTPCGQAPNPLWASSRRVMGKLPRGGELAVPRQTLWRWLATDPKNM